MIHMDFNINESAVKTHAHALFVGANLETTPQTNDDLPVYFGV